MMDGIQRETLHWVPMTQVSHPPSHHHLLHYPNNWWVTNDNGEVLLWRGRDGYDRPQCNLNRGIVETLVKTYAGIGATHVIRLDHGFLPDDPGRY